MGQSKGLLRTVMNLYAGMKASCKRIWRLVGEAMHSGRKLTTQCRKSFWNASNKVEMQTYVQKKMIHWMQDVDFVTIRGKDAIARLPVDEREAFSKFWTDVETLLKKTQTRPR